MRPLDPQCHFRHPWVFSDVLSAQLKPHLRLSANSPEHPQIGCRCYPRCYPFFSIRDTRSAPKCQTSKRDSPKHDRLTIGQVRIRPRPRTCVPGCALAKGANGAGASRSSPPLQSSCLIPESATSRSGWVARRPIPAPKGSATLSRVVTLLVTLALGGIWWRATSTFKRESAGTKVYEQWSSLKYASRRRRAGALHDRAMDRVATSFGPLLRSGSWRRSTTARD